ncbi:hypothetical protein VL14_ORF49 [Staphylococcus phage vB_SauM_VL14]|nr:hypothetical protein VL14_ORF49 [Staphylococcus phage vB_SauM_VL14]
MDNIKGIIVTTTCANFKEGGILFITKDLTSLPLEEALKRVEEGLENNTHIKLPHKDSKGYSIILPSSIVGYDVHIEEEEL